ncbi:TPA: class D sortase [Clostridium perfringens]|uniref:Class D sortase n=1 Tax=Clostridium perfringens TaxID=1502 RepID=A0AAN5SFV1_CLOPF|nr:class D sortase [Clostridium perfringens]MBO3392291.1 class D sortase [Clostridium perfringens]MBO3399358.1 class D sortase [Clostridium perfringens]MBO3408403.1 class D sortase [Clostridium perfringens]MDM0935640.1 class D sortase [Clostridium perfringens]PWX29357.1 class D sortase [Clostridium perfringens]
MRKGLVVLSIIGVILVAVSLFFDFKAKNIQENLIKEYEERTKENNTNEIAEDNGIITEKSQEQTSNTYQNKVNKNNNSATNNDGVIAILKISSINLKVPVVNGEENLNYVVAKYRNSPNFGENGNTILAGHNNMAGSIFKNLYKVKIGEIVEVQKDNEIFKYKITEREIVEPNDPSLLAQDLSKKEITLITCTNRAKQRLILKGELI